MNDKVKATGDSLIQRVTTPHGSEQTIIRVQNRLPRKEHFQKDHATRHATRTKAWNYVTNILENDYQYKGEEHPGYSMTLSFSDRVGLAFNEDSRRWARIYEVRITITSIRKQDEVVF